MTRADLSNDRNVLDLALVSVKKTSARVFEDLPASGRGGRVLDNTAGSRPASCGLPAPVRSER